MTFHHKTPAKHECDPPGGTLPTRLTSLGFGIGTIWQCDQCETYYELQSFDDSWTESDCAWRALSKRVARGRLRRITRREVTPPN